jgi:hypothetical protein
VLFGATLYKSLICILIFNCVADVQENMTQQKYLEPLLASHGSKRVLYYVDPASFSPMINMTNKTPACPRIVTPASELPSYVS